MYIFWYFSDVIEYIWFYYLDKQGGIFEHTNTIPLINESVSFVASEIYYDSGEMDIIFDNSKRIFKYKAIKLELPLQIIIMKY